MAFRLLLRYIIAFLSLNTLMMELHEQAHINTGFAVLGAYGWRNASLWTTASANNALAFLATAAGPLFSYIGIWIGAWLLIRGTSEKSRLFGFAFLFAHMPFARIFTALTGGGDEKVVLLNCLPSSAPLLWVKIINAMLVILICLPPIVMAFNQLAKPYRWKVLLLMNIAPLVFSSFFTHFLLNKLLEKGILLATYFGGTPALIQVSFILMTIVLMLSRKNLYQPAHWFKTWQPATVTLSQGLPSQPNHKPFESAVHV